MKLVQEGLIAKGAEAMVYKGKFLDLSVIIKRRPPKKYRLPQIDQIIRLQRLRAEARIIKLAWQLGIRVPALLGIDTEKRTLIIEEIKGVTLYELVVTLPAFNLIPIFHELGRQIGLLHRNDIVHGDLTVFNVIVDEEIPWLIDFGLAQMTIEHEKHADDLLLFQNTLKAVSPHYKDLIAGFQSIYLETNENGPKVFEQVKKIASRARYIPKNER
ncbi:MAG: KEOPS complex kinase/ATPase Bud32 [Candidatus Heimdallarchaeota archaeon]